MMQKAQKVESINIQSYCKTMSKEKTKSNLCLLTVEKNKKVESVNTQNDYKNPPDFLENPRHDDHYMINMGSQR